MIALSPARRRELRARAHALHPVVSIGHAGLTPAVLKEVDVALKAHELVKVRVHSDDRGEREAHLASICEALDAAPVQHLGKLLIVWRPAPKDDAAPKRPPKGAAPRDARRQDGRRSRHEPQVGARARQHKRGASRHARGPTTIDAPRNPRAAEPVVPTTSAPRGRRYAGGKPVVGPRAKPEQGAPAAVRRRRRPTGGRG
jgi:putative YhbY family RNA-binding protein